MGGRRAPPRWRSWAMKRWRGPRSSSEKIATVRRPSSRAVRMIRMAISPRLATRRLAIFECNISPPRLRQRDEHLEPERADDDRENPLERPLRRAVRQPGAERCQHNAPRREPD